MKRMSTTLMAVFVLLVGGITTGCAATSSPAASSCQDNPKSADCQPPTQGKSASASPSATPTPSAAPPSATPSQAVPSSPAAAQPAAAPAAKKPATEAPAPAPVVPMASSTYPVHTNIVSTTFWVGEIFNASLADGSQVCSTYNSQWAYHHTGVNQGTTPASASGCAGSIYGGCDGASSGSGATFTCATEARDASNGYFPKNQPMPKQNPFYLDLPYDDLNDSVAFQQRCQVIPWAAAENAASGVNRCADGNHSYMKNRWVKLTGPNSKVCYGQIEDAGPSSGAQYHDAPYVFGTNDARPTNLDFSADSSQGAGMDVSPALNGCLGFAELDGSGDKVSWSFVDRANVPAGPWLTVETTSGVNN